MSAPSTRPRRVSSLGLIGPNLTPGASPGQVNSALLERPNWIYRRRSKARHVTRHQRRDRQEQRYADKSARITRFDAEEEWRNQSSRKKRGGTADENSDRRRHHRLAEYVGQHTP